MDLSQLDIAGLPDEETTAEVLAGAEQLKQTVRDTITAFCDLHGLNPNVTECTMDALEDELTDALGKYHEAAAVYSIEAGEEYRKQVRADYIGHQMGV